MDKREALLSDLQRIADRVDDDVSGRVVGVVDRAIDFISPKDLEGCPKCAEVCKILGDSDTSVVRAYNGIYDVMEGDE